MSFTPGPWTVVAASFKDIENADQCWYLIEAKGMKACAGMKALIESAPTMLDALKATYTHLNDSHIGDADTTAVWQQVRDAISAAIGEEYRIEEPAPEPSRVITLTDEDGNECEYLFVDSFEVGGKTYAVLAEAERTCDVCKHRESPRDQHPCSSCYTLTVEQWESAEDFEPDGFLMRLDLDDNGDELFAPLDDDEREAAEAEWARICEQDDEEATLV